jgi:cell division protein FtsN
MKQDSARYVDSIRSLQNELNQLKMSHQKLLDSIKKQQTAEKASYKYHIIVGAFRNQEYLNSYNQFIQDKGFKTKILDNEFGFKMISVDSYKSWRTASKALENIREDVEENAWIYIRG